MTQQENLKFARAVGLKYVDNRELGISRQKHGKKFNYFVAGKKVSDRKTLARIQSLAIPPAWQDVWICRKPDGHLQVTGRDVRGRKQYRYHPEWSRVRNETKFSNLLVFGQQLPKIRKRVRQDLREKKLSKNKVLAAVIQILNDTGLRIGNDAYAQENNSYGLTTLLNKHVDVRGAKIDFHFRGKSGVQIECQLQDKQIAQIVRKCQDLPGQDLFSYVDEEGLAHSLGSSDVNEYLRDITQLQITAKDFRTWLGTVQALRYLSTLPSCDGLNKTDLKKRSLEAINTTAEFLSNTVAVCRKYYVDPKVFAWDEKGWIDIKESGRKPSRTGLDPSEKALLKLLKKKLPTLK